MSSTSIAGKADRRARRRLRRSGRSLVVLPIAVVLLVAVAAVVLIAYVLWPRWPSAAIAPDAPALPITVGGVAFNVPPAAIRVPVQRRPGAHERIDLAFLWPSLEPPDPNAKPPAPTQGTVPAPTHTFRRIFMTIAGAGDTLAPADRAMTIYPRYTAAEAETRSRRSRGSRLPRRHAVSGRGSRSTMRPRRASWCAAPATARGLRPASASTSGGSARPTSWCVSRAIGSATGGRSSSKIDRLIARLQAPRG